MDQIVRRKNSSVMRLASLLFVAVLVWPVHQAVAQTASPQTPAFGQNVKEAYFPFDIYSRIVNKDVLDPNAAWLKQNPDAKMWIQGYADPRGDIVYNLVLSYHRAQFIKTQLEKRGVDGARIEFATGWGKLFQTCDRQDEKCWQENRRVDVVSPQDVMFHPSGQ
jgi:outer membrane protein OmpA-like peptidoglycan-associated protein